MTQSRLLDQFYTNPKIAKQCYEITIKLLKKLGVLYTHQIEPSAGTGSFFNLLPTETRFGIDLEPKCEEVVKLDFFNFEPYSYIANWTRRMLTIGNPPFGKNASLAIQFFNHAATFSSAIAFVVPKSFKKVSTQNKLALNFHLVYEKNLPKKSFLYNGKPYDVPCCFQVWIWKPIPRIKRIYNIENPYFTFVKKTDNPDIAVRRVGGTTGQSKIDVVNASETSHYFLKLKNGINKEKLVSIINEVDVSEIRSNTAGVRSISKGEFVTHLIQYIKGHKL